MIFYRESWTNLYITINSSEPLGLLDSGYVQNWGGLDGYISILHQNGTRYEVPMLEQPSETPFIPHDVFAGAYPLSSLPDGSYMVQGRVRNPAGNYTIFSSIQNPIGNERVLNFDFSISSSQDTMIKPRATVATRFAGGKLPLVALSPGGIAEGNTSAGLEASAWACWVDSRNGFIRLQKVGTVAVDPDAPQVTFLENIDGRTFSKISLSFDQNARRVIAWTDKNTIWLSRVGMGLIEDRASWVGVDCVLFNDAFVLDAAAGEATDIIAFYLSLDRKTVFSRIQSENFTIERPYAVLAEPCSLDTVARASHTVSLYLSPKGKPVISAISAPYPVRGKDAFAIDTALVSGELFEVTVLRDPILEPLSLSASLQGGVLFEVVALRDTTSEPFTHTSSLDSGSYQIVVQTIDLVTEPFTHTPQLSSGIYIDVVVQRDLVAEPITHVVSLQGGSYV